MKPNDRDPSVEERPDDDIPREDVSRRGFLKGAGFAVAATGLVGPAAGATVEAQDKVKVVGPGPVALRLDVNGKTYATKAEPHWTLLDLLRDRLDLTGAKRVCDRGSCGACTVHVDGHAVNSCSMLAHDAVGKKITTIEGLSSGDDLTPVQDAFVKCDALQCGFCTPGMVMACTSFLEKTPNPKSRDEIAEGIAGNICRCGTYQNIFEAVEMASANGDKK